MQHSIYYVILSGLFSHGVNAIWGNGFAGSSLTGSYFGIPLQNETYDYVVIGGGTAGLVVATRLAENPNVTVAVVEAGSFYEISNGNQSQVPFYSTLYVSKDPEDVQPLIDWELVTVPQPQLDGQVIHYAQGKCIGGSSARNQLIYHRGSAGSYDRWAEKVGDDGFAWRNILPYFQKSVNFTTPNSGKRPANATNAKLYNTTAYSSTGGPLHVSYPNGALGISSYAQEAFTAAGFLVSDGFSGGVLNGSQYTPFTVNPDSQLRSSSESSFLQGSFANPTLNLKVYQSTQAMNILFDGNKTAIGVNVSTAGMSYILNARKEVVVSAGAFHSPQLLMVSGVGPASTLEQFNISIIADRPGVGQNMHDTANIGGITFPVTTLSTSTIRNDPLLLAQATQEYLQNQSGILTVGAGDYIGWENFPTSYLSNFSTPTQNYLSTLPSDWPQVEYVLNGNAGVLEATSSNAADGKNYASIGALLLATKSRGNVTISSDSMFDKPVISVNWLLDPIDQEMAVAAYRRAREIWGGFNKSVVVGPEAAPGANYTGYAEILGYIQGKGVGAIHHASSTCMMGRANDSMAVVDPKGRVYGVRNLRVIDSSSFAFTPPGHTQGATYAHAEKLVDDIQNGN